MPVTETIVLDSRPVSVTHRDKVLFPEDGITKGDLAHYYARIAPIMFPHVRDRPLTMYRVPRGIDHDGFFHKEAPDYFPDWIERVEIRLRGGGIQRQVVCEHPADLVYLANQNCITPHVWLSRRDRLNYPDRLIIDLDPPDEPTENLVDAAFAVKEIFDGVGMTSFPLATGARGIHVIVPLDRSADFDAARAFAGEVADIVAESDPERFTTEARIEKRGERVFLDIARNAYGQIGVAPYAVRALPGAPVAAPLDWNEIERNRFNPRAFTIQTIFPRIEERGDLLESVLTRGFSITEAAEKLDEVKSKQ